MTIPLMGAGEKCRSNNIRTTRILKSVVKCIQAIWALYSAIRAIYGPNPEMTINLGVQVSGNVSLLPCTEGQTRLVEALMLALLI